MNKSETYIDSIIFSYDKEDIDFLTKILNKRRTKPRIISWFLSFFTAFIIYMMILTNKSLLIRRILSIIRILSTLISIYWNKISSFLLFKNFLKIGNKFKLDVYHDKLVLTTKYEEKVIFLDDIENIKYVDDYTFILLNNGDIVFINKRCDSEVFKHFYERNNNGEN